MVNTRKKFPRGISDQVISNSSATARAQRALDPGLKLQATSSKRQAFEPTCSSIKRQASSPRQQASSVKPQAASSVILEPRYMDIGEVLEEQGPRVFAKINVLSGCFTWNAIWCGENRSLLPLVTFNSIVQKFPEVLQTNRSGVPSKLEFSILISENCLKFLLIC